MHTIKAHVSTVPENGDVNPYGVAVVPRGAGELRDGHILVSNFNNANNLLGIWKSKKRRSHPPDVDVVRYQTIS